MDLVAGLHWLRENLGAFGGDPERLALLGHGTGAALANFLAVSPMAKGKAFNRFPRLAAGSVEPRARGYQSARFWLTWSHLPLTHIRFA